MALSVLLPTWVSTIFPIRLRTVCRVRFGGIVRNDSDFFRLVADISFVAVARKSFDPDFDFRSSLDFVGATRRGGGVDDRNLSSSGSFSSSQASFAKNLRKNPPVRVRGSGVSGPNDVRLRRRDSSIFRSFPQTRAKRWVGTRTPDVILNVMDMSTWRGSRPARAG